MARITLTTNSNWSTCSDGSNTGGPPSPGDIIDLNTRVLTLDGADGATFDLGTGTIRATDGAGTPAATSGSITLGAGVTTTYTLIANLQGGNSGTLFNAGPRTAHIVGNIRGGNTTSTTGVLVPSTAVVTITGDVTGGISTLTHGVVLNAGTLTVTGTATGGQTQGSHGINCTAGAASVGSVGIAKGGPVVGALGVLLNFNGASFTVNGTDLTGVGYPIGVGLGTMHIANTAKLIYNNPSTGLLTNVFYGSALLPAAAEVGVGVSYGGGDFLGTLVSAAKGFVMGG